MSTRNKKERRNLTSQQQEAKQFAAGQEFSVYAAYRKSPFPPIEELEKYEGFHPGVTKQLVDNYVKQTDHRIELEKIVVEGDNKRANTGQHYSFIITLAFLVMAIVLFVIGKDIPAVVSVITGIVPVIISFINASIKRKEEREAKRKNMGL